MHIVALVWADPRVIGHVVLGEVGAQLGQLDELRQPLRAVLDIRERDERVVLALVELVATGVVELRRTERVRLCSPSTTCDGSSSWSTMFGRSTVTSLSLGTP